MEWNTETQSVIFFERTEFTEQKFGSMAFAYSIYFSVSSCLCVQYKGLHRFFAIHF